MTRERVLSYPLAGPKQRVDEGAEGSDSALFSRHANVGDAILIIDLGHRRKPEVGVKGLQVRLRPEVNCLLRPVLLTTGQRLLHQLIAELLTAGGGATDEPDNHQRNERL